MRIEKPHLDCAIAASPGPPVPRGLLVVHWHGIGKVTGAESAGIPNPCAYINQPARAHAGRSEPMATARLGGRNNHYGRLMQCNGRRTRGPEARALGPGT